MSLDEFLSRARELEKLPPGQQRDAAEELDEDAEEEAYAGGAMTVFDLDRLRNEIYTITGYRYGDNAKK